MGLIIDFDKIAERPGRAGSAKPTPGFVVRNGSAIGRLFRRASRRAAVLGRRHPATQDRRSLNARHRQLAALRRINLALAEINRSLDELDIA